MEVVIPCAGKSSRFPNLRPKYLLTDYSGKLMIERVVEDYLDKASITIVILQEHESEFGVISKLTELFGNHVKVKILPELTTGPAESIYKAIESIRTDDNLLVRDSDSFFKHGDIEGNSVFVAKLSDYPNLENVSQKSFAIANNQEVVLSLVEKRVVSENICVGGYQFESLYDYRKAFKKLKEKMDDKEIYVSHVIDFLISGGAVFNLSFVDEYVDVGTSKDWFRFNDKPTFFCDIDGVLLKSKLSYEESHEAIYENVEVLKSKEAYGCKIVFVTSRPEKYRTRTYRILKELGFQNFELVMGMNHSSRILINDFAPSNPYPSAKAINIPRDDDQLGSYI